MDAAVAQSGLGSTHASLFQESRQNDLLSEVQDQLGAGFDLDADLEFGDGVTQVRKSKRKSGTHLPSHLTDIFGRANLAYSLGNYTEAMSLLHEIIKESPTSTQPWAQLAMIHDELGESQKALQTYLVAAHLIRTDGDLWRRIGNMSMFVS